MDPFGVTLGASGTALMGRATLAICAQVLGGDCFEIEVAGASIFGAAPAGLVMRAAML